MISYALFAALSDSVSKLIYISNPKIGFLEFVFFRGLLQVIVVWALIFRKEKKVLYDDVPKSMFKLLGLRIFMGVLQFGFMFYSMKYVPIIICALFLNMTPIFTSGLAFLFLKERITKLEIFCLLLAFFGVY